MASATRSRTARCNEYRLPAALRRRMPEGGDESARLWADFHATGNPIARNSLIEFYAPLAMISAAVIKRQYPTLYREPLEELQSDGLYGLIKAIDGKPYVGHLQVRHYLHSLIRRTIRREQILRGWMGRRLQERQGVIERMRSELTQELNRVPTSAEMTDRLSGLITNPDICVGKQANMYPASQTKPLRHAARLAADKREKPPERGAMEREVMDLASRKLCKEDRDMLRKVLRGESATSIARQLGIGKTAAFQRINGLLWTLRCRADLAAYLEVQAADVIPRNASYHPLTVSKFPPARRAM